MSLQDRLAELGMRGLIPDHEPTPDPLDVPAGRDFSAGVRYGIKCTEADFYSVLGDKTRADYAAAQAASVPIRFHEFGDVRSLGDVVDYGQQKLGEFALPIVLTFVIVIIFRRDRLLSILNRAAARIRALLSEKSEAEETLYEQVAAEIANDDVRRGLWLKATTEAQGDKSRAQAFYVKYRVAQLRQEQRAAQERAEKELRETHERDRAERLQEAAEVRTEILRLRDASMSNYLIAEELTARGVAVPVAYGGPKSWTPDLVRIIAVDMW